MVRSTCFWLISAATVAFACNSDDSLFSPNVGGGTTGVAGGHGGGGATGAGGAGTGATGTGATGAGATGGGGPSCPGGGLEPGKHSFTIDFDGKQRQYDLRVPAGYDDSAAIALVVEFHGYASTNWQQHLISGFAALADQEGFAVAWPNGYGLSRSWNAGDFCCGAAKNEGLDDVGLARAIVQQVSANLCVDPKRIYATGISNGGAMSHRLACEAADLFAAIAPVSFPIDFDPLTKCQPTRPIAVMHLHGLNDLVVPYGGNATSVPVQDSFARWAEIDGCSGGAQETYSKGGSHCDTHETCNAAANVSLCSINGGHVLYTNTDAVPVAELAWQFLSAHTLP